MRNLRTIIVDDYQMDVGQITQTISHGFPQIKIIDNFRIEPESLDKISQSSPDLVFFDVGRPKMSGLKLLENWALRPQCHFVLTDIERLPNHKRFLPTKTDCLKKPICGHKLNRILMNVLYQHQIESLRQELATLKQVVSNSIQSKIAIPTLNGLNFIEYANIIYAEAADNYSILHLSDGNQMLSSQNLVKLEKQLEHLPFLRIHRCSLVNLNHVKSYIRGDGGQLILSDNKSLNVSRKKKEILIETLYRNH